MRPTERHIRRPMPHRVSPQGSYRLDRVFPGVGRINVSSGARRVAEFTKRNALLDELYETGRLDLLRAIKAQRLAVVEVFAAQRAHQLSFLSADVLVRRDLWDEVAAWLPRSARAPATQARYRASWGALLHVLQERFPARVQDLAAVPWAELHRTWGKSPADWNHVRRAVSRFLTVLLGDKWHPFRRLVVQAIPRAREPKARIPDLSPALFWKLVAATPAYVQPAYVALAATGLRVRSEYLRLRETDLRPHTYGLQIPGTKTPGSADVLIVGKAWWPWIRRAVPAPLGYAWLRKHWRRACAKLEVTDVTLHSLRHCAAQWAVNAGVPEASVQAALRHETAATTRIYTLQKARGQMTQALAGVLLARKRKKGAA